MCSNQRICEPKIFRKGSAWIPPLKEPLNIVRSDAEGERGERGETGERERGEREK